MLTGFKEFIMRGNVVDLAVAVVIGAAFGKIIDAIATDLIGGLIAAVVGKPDFNSLTFKLGDTAINYGTTITALINFLILAFVIFMIVRSANKVMKRAEDAGTPEDILLLREIRDSVKK